MQKLSYTVWHESLLNMLFFLSIFIHKSIRYFNLGLFLYAIALGIFLKSNSISAIQRQQQHKRVKMDLNMKCWRMNGWQICWIIDKKRIKTMKMGALQQQQQHTHHFDGKENRCGQLLFLNAFKSQPQSYQNAHTDALTYFQLTRAKGDGGGC